MTPATEIISACGIVLTVSGGAFAYIVHATSKYSVDIAMAKRDASEALATTKTHTVQLAVTTDHAETALKLGEKHTAALSDTVARVSSMESVYADIRTKLGTLDGLRDDIGELKTAVGVLSEQGQNMRNEVQECKNAIAALNTKSPRRQSSKRRKR